MFIQNTLIDNSEGFMLSEYLREMLGKEEYRRLRIATGYWDLAGMKLLQKELEAYFERGGILDLLIGQEPQLRSYQMRSDLTKEEKFPDFYIQKDIEKLSDDYQPLVKLLLEHTNPDDESQSQVKIRVYGQDGEEQRFLHAKCYIFSGYGVAHGIIGSSNFTEKGLQGNAELNYLEANPRIVDGAITEYGKSHIAWFNEMWEQSVPWTGRFIKDILAPSPVGRKAKKAIEVEPDSGLTPYEVYIKYLQEQLGDIADPEAGTVLKSYLPKEYSSLSYQMDAVQQCFFIMKNHGGFILGDVVGLGKTVVGLLVIKKFLAEANLLQRDRKVLIVTPPAIKRAWENTITDFDKDSVDKVGDCVRFITTGSLGKLIDEADNVGEDSEEFDETLGYDNYGLIVIDESHNFSNNQTQKYKDLDSLIGDILLRTGKAPFVGLLSATPQNNSPIDIKNQIYLFQREPNKSSLPNVPGGKLDSFFSRMITDFAKARKDSNSPEGKRMLNYVASEIREKVLNDLVVRRTRTDIRKHYAEDSENLKFPTVKEPHKLEYTLDEELCALFFDTITAIVKEDYKPFDPSVNLGFYRYTAISYFKSPEHKRLYEGRNVSVERVSKQLSNIMRILLVKRLESSFTAFKASLHNLQQYTQNMIDMLQNDMVYICPDIDVNKEIEKAGGLENAIPRLEALIAKKGKNNRKFSRADFDDAYLLDLKQDMKLINQLCKRWDKNEYDPKMDAFKKHLATDLFDKDINNPHGYDKPRLVIFTEAIDTLDSLVRYIKTTGHKPLKISAKNRDEMHKAIVENFDANSKVQKDEYDVLVTTEVLAEGINLHRSNVILNYDTPWNATRLMQRIGRVNRIGSKEDFVHVFNFYPTTQSNEQIKLVEIAYAKLQAFHTMFGEDNKVFSELEELSEADFNKLIDDEESPFGKFISDLKAYQKSLPDRYAAIKAMPLESLGGVFRDSSDSDKAVAVITAENRGLTNILYTEEDVKIISPLECMAELKCEEDSEFASGAESISEDIKDAILKCYQQHVTQMANAKDSSGVVRAANKFLHDLENELTSEEARNAWTAANRALRGNNTTVARKLLKFKEEREANGGSLFGVDYDIDSWLAAAFSTIAEKARIKYGDPVIAICEKE